MFIIVESALSGAMPFTGMVRIKMMAGGHRDLALVVGESLEKTISDGGWSMSGAGADGSALTTYNVKSVSIGSVDGGTFKEVSSITPSRVLSTGHVWTDGLVGELVGPVMRFTIHPLAGAGGSMDFASGAPCAMYPQMWLFYVHKPGTTCPRSPVAHEYSKDPYNYAFSPKDYNDRSAGPAWAIAHMNQNIARLHSIFKGSVKGQSAFAVPVIYDGQNGSDIQMIDTASPYADTAGHANDGQVYITCKNVNGLPNGYTGSGGFLIRQTQSGGVVTGASFIPGPGKTMANPGGCMKFTPLTGRLDTCYGKDIEGWLCGVLLPSKFAGSESIAPQCKSASAEAAHAEHTQEYMNAQTMNQLCASFEYSNPGYQCKNVGPANHSAWSIPSPLPDFHKAPF